MRAAHWITYRIIHVAYDKDDLLPDMCLEK